MTRFITSFSRVCMLCAAAVAAVACAAGTNVRSTQSLVQLPSDFREGADVFQAPALVAFDANTDALAYWPIQPGGADHPRRLSNALNVGFATGIAGDGRLLAIATLYPSEVLLYDIPSRKVKTLPDPYGTPIDIAIDRTEALYVVNVATTGNVVMYSAGSRRPKELDCKYIDTGESIAVDDEGDIFVNGYTGQWAGVVEIPNGPNGPEPQNCMKLALKSEPGYVAGIAVDPKTDDLVVLDNPDDCAGGIEGRMTIYPKPYRRETGRSHDLGANCAGSLRLNADSTRVYVNDQDVSGSFSFVLQRSYPDGKNMGAYRNGQPEGFITVPNSLPN